MLEFLEDAIDFVKENPIKCACGVVATIATGGGCLVAAPIIASTLGGAGLLGAASTGTAISSLSGAALTNASLAALGGGAVAAGGGGMVAGTVVVATAGATTAGVASAAVIESTTD